MAEDSLKSGRAKKTADKKGSDAAKKEAAAAGELEKKKRTSKPKTTESKKELKPKKKAEKKDTAAVSQAEKVEVSEKNKSSVEKKQAKKQEKISISGKTTFVKPAEVKKDWLILDAKGKSLGRVAAVAASLLRGKHKVDFTPNVDCGDSVIIINCSEAVLTGKKLNQKIYYRHSGWIGGLKKVPYFELMKKFPQKAMAMAVEGMLPKGSLGSKMARHLRVYKDSEHGHEAQKPRVFEF